MGRNNGSGNTNYRSGQKKKNRNNGPKLVCWYCKKPMSRSNVRKWGSHLVHEGSCYKYCCKNLITTKNLLGKIRNSQPPPRKGFLARLLGL